MSHRTRTPLSQGQIDAMITFGTERMILQGAAAHREIARLRRELGLPEPAGESGEAGENCSLPEETLGARR